MVTATESPAPYALRIWVPRYDDRDAIDGRTGYASKMRYGTVAGALARAMMNEASEDEIEVEIIDTRTGRPVPHAEIFAVLTRARKQNPSIWFGYNDKDALPF